MGQCADLTAGVLLMQLNLNVLLVLHGKNEDIARKEAVLAQKQRELRQREREEILEKRRHTEKLRRRARYSLDELGVMFATSGANKNKNVVARFNQLGSRRLWLSSWSRNPWYTFER